MDALLTARPVIAIVGPTASGKTDVAQFVAEELDGEVLSADSMQIYRGMDIGTGKLPVSERRVPHHGLDIVDPDHPYSAALYQAYARETMADIAARGRRTVLAGGTGFYVRAALDDYEFAAGEQVGNAVRDRYTAYAEEHGAQALWEMLEERDPESAAVIHPNNIPRVVRAFELLEEGESYAARKANLKGIAQAVPAHLYGLQVDPDLLRTRIDRRVDAMVDAGLVQEVESLLESGFRDAVTAPHAIGYKEIVDALEGRCSREEAIERIKAATRKYAKRQRTWFRSDKRITWLDADDADARRIADEIIALESAGDAGRNGVVTG